MFIKISFILLSIGLSGLVQGAAIDDYTANIEAIVQSLSGVYCLADTARDFKDATDEFLYKIKKSCGSDAVTNLATELDDAKKLMHITSEVIKINDRTCDNADYDEDLDGETDSQTKCVSKLTTQMNKLLASFSTTQTDITSGLQKDYSSGYCVKMTMSNFKYFLDSFPSRIEICAQIVA